MFEYYWIPLSLDCPSVWSAVWGVLKPRTICRLVVYCIHIPARSSGSAAGKFPSHLMWFGLPLISLPPCVAWAPARSLARIIFHDGGRISSLWISMPDIKLILCWFRIFELDIYLWNVWIYRFKRLLPVLPARPLARSHHLPWWRKEKHDVDFPVHDTIFIHLLARIFANVHFDIKCLNLLNPVCLVFPVINIACL